MSYRLPLRSLFLFAASTVTAAALSACRPNPSHPPRQSDQAAGTSPSAAPSAAPAPTTTPTPAPAPAPAAKLAALLVNVTDLRARKGQLIFGVFKSADGFPTEAAKSVNWQIKDADADTVTFTTSLPPGQYGASVLHDENRNGKMDRNFAGVPLEGYGVTNNPKPALRAATFKEATFTLPPQGTTMTISIQYF